MDKIYFKQAEIKYHYIFNNYVDSPVAVGKYFSIFKIFLAYVQHHNLTKNQIIVVMICYN